MLTVNNTTTTLDPTMYTEDNPQLYITYYSIESDDTNLIVDTQATQDNSSALYTGVVTRNNTTNSELVLETVIVNTNSTGTYSQITATNNSGTVTKWALISTSGQTLYTTNGTYSRGKTCTIDLKTISTLQLGTQFKLKAIVSAGKDSASNMILTFNPSSNQTANFQLKGTAFKTSVNYLSTTTN